MSQHLINIHSNVQQKSPQASQLDYGEIAINYNSASPKIFIKNSANNIVEFIDKVGVGALIDSKIVTKFLTPTDAQIPSAKLVNETITENEQVTAAALTNLNTSKQDKITDLDTIRLNASAGKTASDNLGGHTVGINVPSNAVFTDTHYTTGLKVGASSTATTNAASSNGSTYINALDNTAVRDSHLIKGTGKASVTSDANGVITINAAAGTYEETAGSGTATADSGYALSSVSLSAGHVLSKGAQVKIPSTPGEVGAAASNHTHDDRYYTESEIDTKLSGKSDTGHTHSYEPTSTAVRHTASTAVGSTTQPVYITSAGTATAIGYTIAKNVPSDAKFTDTNTTYGLTSSNATVTLTPSSGSASSITVNNVAKATAADHVVSAVTFSAGTFGSNVSYSGNTAPTVNIPTHTSHLTNNSDFTTKAYVDGLVASPVNYRGAITNATLPASGSTKVGDLYIVQTSAITLTATQSATGAAQTAEPGDYIIARTKATWDVIQKNINNAVTGKDATAFGDGKIIVGTGSGQVVSASTYTIATSVPANAVFTDTHDTNVAGTGIAVSGTRGSTIAISSGYQTNISHGETAYGWGNHANAGYAASGHTHDDRYYTENEINTKLSGKSDTGHTHNYEPTSTAVRHTASTAVGSTTQPVYVDSTGKATVIGYTIAKSVPSDAVFTDTNTKVTSVGNHYTPASSTTKSASTNYAIAGIKMDAAGHVTDVVNSAHKVEKDVPSDAAFTDTHDTNAAGTGIAVSGTRGNTIAISSTYQTYISNGNTAHGWGNHASAGYAHLANTETFTGTKTFNQPIGVTSAANIQYDATNECIKFVFA